MRERAKLSDIARDAQVSAATVSRVLNGTHAVSPALRARVLASAERLGYYPNIIAKSLRTRHSHVLGVVVPSVTSPYFADVIQAVEEVAMASGYAITVCSHGQDTAKERRHLHVLRDRMADGVLITVADRTASDLRPLIAAGMPVVLMDRTLDGAVLDAVTVDTEGGTYAAVAYLAGRGYRRIAFLGGPATISTAGDKLRGYTRALDAHDLTARDDLILCGDYLEQSGFELGCQILGMDARPDAVIIASSLMTLGFCRALAQSGLRVPHDIAYLGFEESPWSDLMLPPMSRVVQPTYEVGRAATTMLLERIRGHYSGEARHRRLPAELVIRGSC